MTQSRTHNCGELRQSDVGSAVTLCGWMENMREVGGNLAFVILRDFYGTTQLVAEDEEMFKKFKEITKESTIRIEGTVRERSNKNPKIPTGDIEVVPTSVTVLGRNRNNESRLRVIRNGVPGEELTLYRGETNCIQRLGQYAPGEKAVFEFELSSGALYTQDNLFYVLDTQVLQEQTDAMKARALTITKFGSGYIRGTLPDAASGGGTMLIQVPYNAGWTVKADGVKVQTAALLEGLLTAEIPAGTKTVEIRFRAKGELPGLALSGAALVFCAASMLAAVIKKRRFSA